jgi:hypothetical protein
MNKEIKIEAAPRQGITLDGIHGVFRIQNCDFDIHYFSTYATPSAQSAEGSYSALLDELKPMRERVKAKDLKDLSTLLQRDLSDQRIARELVPYLCGEISKVGFFPPVLAVLVPTGFIESGDSDKNSYPLPSSKGGATDYGDLWQLRMHAGTQRLGRLSIYSGTEVIVLDGQHRANAFRYVSGVLKPTDLYSIFYAGVTRPATFASDLPVVIVWFESVGKKPVKPNDISRELFVAVNNNAKTVSQSRTILLDEANPVCLAVNAYYSTIARKRGFKTGGMNLLCGCFDVDVDETMANYRPIFALTDPVALKTAITYAFFALEKYDKLDCSKANRKAQTNKSRFERLFGPLSYIDTGGGKRIKPLTDVNSRQDFRKKTEAKFVPILDALFEQSKLAACHHKAVAAVEDWVTNDGVSTIVVDTWEKVFCGGEGLFGQIQMSDSPHAKNYQKAIKEIQDKFREFRRDCVRKASGSRHKFTDGAIDRAFDLFDTIACQTGLLMALSVYMKALHLKKVRPADASRKACELIGSPTVADWILFLNEFRQLYFSNLEANSWPRFQKLFLRLFCSEIDTFVKEPAWAPESEMVSERAVGILKARQESGASITPADVSSAVDTALSEVEAAFKPLKTKLVNKKAIKATAKVVAEAYRKQSDKKQASNALQGATAEDDEADDDKI